MAAFSIRRLYNHTNFNEYCNTQNNTFTIPYYLNSKNILPRKNENFKTVRVNQIILINAHQTEYIKANSFFDLSCAVKVGAIFFLTCSLLVKINL